MGMSAAGLQLDSGHASGEVQVSLQAGQPSFDIVADRAYDHIDAGSLPRINPHSFTMARWHCEMLSLQAALNHLLQHCQSPVFMDVNLRPPWWNLGQTLALLGRARWSR